MSNPDATKEARNNAADARWLKQVKKRSDTLIIELEHFLTVISTNKEQGPENSSRAETALKKIVEYRERLQADWAYGPYGLGECHVPEDGR